jgi:branched-chain amino acid transport system substrate-binding protein
MKGITMKHTGKKIFGVAATAALLLSGCAGGGGDDGGGGGEGGGEEIVIGAVYSVTGSQASIDEPGLKGFELAAEQINEEGGILGRQVRVAHADAQSDATTLTNVVNELIENDGAVALGGINDSTFALAAGPIAQTAGVPFVGAGATLPSLPEQIGDFYFMACFGDDAQAYAIADYAMEELDATTAWVLEDQAYDFTTALSAFFQERWTEAGGEVVLEDTYQSGDTDYSAQIARLQALDEQPDVLFVSAIPNEAGIITQQIRAAGLTQPILSGDGYDTPLLMEVAGENADEVYFSTHMSLTSEDEEVTSFVQAYEEKYGSGPENAFAALGYDTMMLIADAIERAGDADPQAIRDALAETSELALTTGTVSYEEGSRKPTKSVTIIKVDDAVPAAVQEVTP